MTQLWNTDLEDEAETWDKAREDFEPAEEDDDWEEDDDLESSLLK